MRKRNLWSAAVQLLSLKPPDIVFATFPQLWFLNILMISYCLAFLGSKQSVRSKFLLEPLLVTTCLHLQSRADLQEFFRTRVSRHDVWTECEFGNNSRIWCSQAFSSLSVATALWTCSAASCFLWSAFCQQHVGSRLGGVNSASTVRQKGEWVVRQSCPDSQLQSSVLLGYNFRMVAEPVCS